MPNNSGNSTGAADSGWETYVDNAPVPADTDPPMYADNLEDSWRRF